MMTKLCKVYFLRAVMLISGVQVMHGADRDIVWLQRDFGIYVCNMFDTGQVCRSQRIWLSSELLCRVYWNWNVLIVARMMERLG